MNGGYVFTCPECGGSLEVNDPMRETLIERGCVVCGAPVTAEVFTSNSADDTS